MAAAPFGTTSSNVYSSVFSHILSRISFWTLEWQHLWSWAGAGHQLPGALVENWAHSSPSHRVCQPSLQYSQKSSGPEGTVVSWPCRACLKRFVQKRVNDRFSAGSPKEMSVLKCRTFAFTVGGVIVTCSYRQC